ncbi:MAG: type IV pilus biogenesis protein PilP [Acetobacteraceae bacterium]|nr:type IV pilus biogenesis protein PilP [Acetobacteraceae bacterium]
MTARILCAAWVCLSVLPIAGYAADGATDAQPSDAQPSNETTAQTLERLNGQAAILEVQARIAKARREIAEAEKGAGGGERVGGALQAAPAATPERAAPVVLPIVQMILGGGRDLTAELALPDGGIAVVAAGSTIRGLGRVLTISERGVVVDASGEHLTLPFGSEGDARASQTGRGQVAPAGTRPMVQLPPSPLPGAR